MKKIFTPLLITATLLIASSSFGQAYNNSIDIGIRGNACDQLVIEWNSSYNFTGAENAWSQATMTITWDQALGANVLGTITSLLPGFTGWQYNGVAVLVGAEYRREVILFAGGYNQDIPIGVTEVVAITLNGTGTGTFTLADPNGNTNISNGLLGTNIWSGVFNPNPATGVSLDDKIVWNGTEWCGGSGTNNQPGAGDTKPCFVTGLGGQLTQAGASVGSLTIQVGGELSIMPGASLDNPGNTTIAQPQGLIIAADASGSGSYIDNGTINYTGSGSAKVQTYIANTATPGNFHIHQIGPTVKNPSFSTTYPGESGVFLGEFDLTTGGTYAYRYSEPVNNWINFWQTTEPIPTACGFIFSDVSGTPSTLEMVGQLATDDGSTTYILTPSGSSPLPQWGVTYTSTGGQGNFLASNPYPSGLDLKAFWNTYNVTFLGLSMRIWDENAGNYAVMTWDNTPPLPINAWVYTNALSGTNGLINPGQGFFIETLPGYSTTWGDQIWFFSTMRAHYHGPFIKQAEESGINRFRLTASNNYYQDELIVKFADGNSSGFDMYDAEKWASMYDDALEVSSLSTDLAALTINSLPTLDGMISVPVNFEPGITGEFTFEFSGTDSFEPGTEFFLEDLQTGTPWINLLTNPVYQFTGNTNDPQNRFVLHFFGPTGIGDPGAEISPVQIYSYDHDAYIVNRGNEVIEEYVVYDMMGRELQRGSLPSTTVNKVFIGQVSGYYIVKVVTNSRIYSEKVFINR